MFFFVLYAASFFATMEEQEALVVPDSPRVVGVGVGVGVRCSETTIIFVRSFVL